MIEPEYAEEIECEDEEQPVSEPCLTKFIPFGYQCDVMAFLDDYDYSQYTPEIMLSGSVGSAKSVLLAHLIIMHCLENPRACVAIGRFSMPDLKKTLFKEVIEHLTAGSQGPCLIERFHYKVKHQTAEIVFRNGSVIEGISWGDGNFQKFRSRKWSMLVIEELTENIKVPGFLLGLKIMKARLRRIPWVKVNIFIGATNPDEPEGDIHDYFIVGSKHQDYKHSRFVFYSKTVENPYLDPAYLRQLMQDYSVLEAERYLEGKWISLEGKGIYHAYSEEWNLCRDPFQIDWRRPLHLTFDFNTAEGKPQSCAASQAIPHMFGAKRMDRYHFFRESVIDNANWCLDNLDDFDAQGLFWTDMEVQPGVFERRTFPKVIVHGDASGKASSSNSLRSNYDLIRGWFAEKGIACELQVPKSNPALVKRWTTVNALCQNALKESRIIVYVTCPVLNQGMKNAKKKPGTAIEDDSKRYQHITTALGYQVCYIKSQESHGQTTVVKY